VSECPGVDDDARGALAMGLEEVEDGPFVVALEPHYLDTPFAGRGNDRALDVGEGRCAVDLRLAFAEEVQVRAMDEQDKRTVGHRATLPSTRVNRHQSARVRSSSPSPAKSGEGAGG
jgi:hypothetical protein